MAAHGGSRRRMAGAASAHRPVTRQVCGRVAMTPQTEIVKARLSADPKGHATAAMATDARIGTGAIGEVVMTLNAVHREMLVVREGEDQRLAPRPEGLTQSQCSSSRQQRRQCDE